MAIEYSICMCIKGKVKRDKRSESIQLPSERVQQCSAVLVPQDNPASLLYKLPQIPFTLVNPLSKIRLGQIF